MLLLGLLHKSVAGSDMATPLEEIDQFLGSATVDDVPEATIPDKPLPQPSIDEFLESGRSLNEGLNKAQRYPLHAVAEIGSLGAGPLPLLSLGKAVYDWAADPNVRHFRQAMVKPEFRYLTGELIDAERRGDQERMRQIAGVLPADSTVALKPWIRYGLDWYGIGTDAANWVSQTLFNEEFDRKPGETPLDEELAGVGLSALLAVPIKAGTLPSQLATSAAVRNTARVAEVLTPVTFPATKANIVANAAGGMLITDVSRALSGESSVMRMAAGMAVPDVEAASLSAPEQSIDEFLLSGEDDDGQTSTATKVALGIGALSAITLALRGKYKTPKIENVVEAGPMLGGAGPESAGTARTAWAATQAKITQGAGLESMTRQFADADRAEAFSDAMLIATRSGGDAGRRFFGATGRLPGSSIVTVPLGEWGNRVARLTPEQRTLLNEGTIAMNVQRDRKLSNGQRPIATDWSDNDVQARINALNAVPEVKAAYDDAQRILSDGWMYAYHMGEIDRNTYLKGVRDWTGAYFPNIQPARASMDKPGLWSRMMSRFDVGDPERDFVSLPRQSARGEQGVNVFEADVPKMLDRYMGNLIARVQNNSARRNYIDTMGYVDPMLKNPQANAHTAASGRIRRVPQNKVDSRWHSNPNPRVEEDVIRVKRNGTNEYYQVGDKFVARELEFAPHNTFKYMDATRRWWQAWTTGIAAPWRAPRAAMWDTFIGAFGRKPNRAFGYIDELVLRATGGKANSAIFDPTAFIWNLEGAARGAWGQANEQLHSLIKQGLIDNSGWLGNMADTAIGARKLDQMARNAQRRWMASTYYQMHAHGFSNTSFLADAAAVGRTIMSSEIARRLPASDVATQRFGNFAASPAINTFFRPYQILMDSVHNSAKYAYVARNAAIQRRNLGRRLNDREWDKLVVEARNLAGDMSRHVDVGTRLASSVPYANVAVQSMAHLGRAATRDPHSALNFMLTGGTLGLMFIGAKNWLMAQGGAEWYYRDLAPWQRASQLHILHPDEAWEWYQDPENYEFDPDKIMQITLPPELMPGVLMMDSMYEDLMAPERAREQLTGKGSDAVMALGNLVGFAFPPGVTIPLSWGQVLAEEIIGEDRQPVSFDFQRMIEEADVGQLIQVRDPSKLAGVDMNSMYPNTYLSDNVHSALSATFGTFGNILGSVGEAYGADVDGDKLGEAFDEATENTAGRELAEQVSRRVELSSLWTGYNKRYLGSTRSRVVHERLQDLEAAFKQYGVEMGQVPGQTEPQSMSDIFLDPAAANFANRISDPTVKRMVSQTYMRFKRSPVYSQNMPRINALRRKYTAVQGNFNMPSHERNQALNEIVTELQGHYETLADDGAEYERWMKEQYGEQWSIPWMLDRIKETATIPPNQ